VAKHSDSLGHPNQHAPTDVDDLLEVNRKRIRALVAADFETLERYVADDMEYVAGDGSVHPKVKVFAGFRDGSLRLEKQDPYAESGRIYGDTGITSYRADSVTIHDSKRIEATTQCTSVYVWRDARWQLVLQHNTFVE
jgi:hypothetical protein